MKFLCLTAIIFFLSACAEEKSDEVSDTLGKQIADDYTDALEKAADVETELLEQKQRMDEALEEAERAVQDP